MSEFYHHRSTKAQVPGFAHGQMCVSIICCEKVEKQGALARNVSFKLFIPIETINNIHVSDL